MKKNHRHTAAIIVGVIVLGGIVFAFKKGVFAPVPLSGTASDSITPISEPVVVPDPVPVKEMTYHTITLGTSKLGAQIIEAVGKENLDAVLSLNRVDIGHLQNNQVIVVPDNFDDPFSLSSFPKEIPDLASIPKMMLVSQKIQEFALYEHGSLIRFGAVSTGKKSTPSPSRLYYTNWKGKSVTSSIDDEWIMPWYFNLDNMEGISMHQFDLPGYAASHSCVRMSEDNAKFIYDWADQWILSLDDTVIASGTPVLLFDEYVYGKPGPWKKLPEDSHVMTLSVDYLEQKITPNLDDIQKKQTERDAVIAEKTNSL